MHVTTHTKMATIANVFGIIQGDVEPGEIPHILTIIINAPYLFAVVTLKWIIQV